MENLLAAEIGEKGGDVGRRRRHLFHRLEPRRRLEGLLGIEGDAEEIISYCWKGLFTSEKQALTF